MSDDLTEYALRGKAEDIESDDLTELALSDTLQAISAADEHFECDNCEEKKESSSFRLDPFCEDVHNRQVYRMLCDDCERELRLDI